MPANSFEQDLDTYAELAVKVGVNVQPGQRLLVRASWASAPLAALVAKHAYQAGARLVDTIYSDPELSLARFKYAPRDSFGEISAWPIEAGIEYAKRGDGLLSIRGDDPDLLRGQDPKLIAQERQAWAMAARGLSSYIMSDAINWSIVAYPVQGWAAKVFPDAPEGEQIDLLWQAIFDICRVHESNPIEAWHKHDKVLNNRADFLTEKQYASLHITGPGTDLMVGIADNHRWLGGGNKCANGIHSVANMPTEEVFTAPHCNRVDGTVRATMPLSYSGNLLEGFSLTFKDGRVVDYSAEKGGELLKTLVEMDDGSSRLGELALVPSSSPIAQSGRLFYNTLYDENATTHIALGRAYKMCVADGAELSDEQFAAGGGNDSLAHVDFMIGSAQVDIDGIKADGSAEPLMRAGEFVTGPR